MRALFISLMVVCASSVLAQNQSTVYQQLCKLNKEWKSKPIFDPVLNETTSLPNDVDLIQMHLTLVEKYLRNHTPEGLTQQQLKNRNQGLDILASYCKRVIFPQNIYHVERTPYFIDHLGTACAVGHIVIETGYTEVSKKISRENNYGYLHDLVKIYPEILTWANEYGFTEDELAWIQPTYGGGCIMAGSGSVVSGTCSSSCDGVVVLPVPTSGNPPYTISGPPSCTNLCPGNYTWFIIDGGGNTTAFNANVGFTDSVSFQLDSMNISSSLNCDGSIIVTPDSGIPPFVYTLYDSTMTPITSGVDSIFNNLCSGNYYVQVTDSYGCTQNPISVSLGSDSGVDIYEIISSGEIKVFPNPAHDVLSLSFSENASNSLSVIGVDGREVMNIPVNGLRIKFDISSLENGYYFILLNKESGRLIRFMKN